MDLAWKMVMLEVSLLFGDFFLGGVDGSIHLLHWTRLGLCFSVPGPRCPLPGHKIAAEVVAVADCNLQCDALPSDDFWEDAAMLTEEEEAEGEEEEDVAVAVGMAAAGHCLLQ